MKNLMKKSKKGFTLMEMLIVVAIIAILVVIAIPTFTNALNEAKTNTDMANARAWYSELVVYAMLNDDAISEGAEGLPTAPTPEATNGTFTFTGSNSSNIVVTYKQGNDTIATFPQN